MGTGEFNAGGNHAMDWHPIQGGVEIFLVASCHGNRDKLRPDEPLGSYADLSNMCSYISLSAQYCQQVNLGLPMKKKSSLIQLKGETELTMTSGGS